MAGMQENYKQQTALMQATRSGMTSMVEKLLAAGAKTETTDKDGNTSFLLAISNYAEAFQMLTNGQTAASIFGVDAPTPATPEMLAASNQAARMAEILIAATASAGALDVQVGEFRAVGECG
jgi:ankyrin repeat protein